MEESNVVIPRNSSAFFSLPSATPKLVNIYAGGCGANAAIASILKYDPSENPHANYLVLESNSSVLREHFGRREDPSDKDAVRVFEYLDQGRLKIITLGPGSGAGGDPGKGEELLRPKLEEAQAFIQGAHAVVQVGGGGGGTAGGVLPLMAQTLVEMQIPIFSVLTIPRLREGSAKLAKAHWTRDRLLELCPTTLIYNERILNKKVPYSEIWRDINESCLFRILEFLRKLIMTTADIQDRDISDWISDSKVGNHVLPGYFDASQGMSDMRKALLGNRYLNTKVLKKALRLSFLFEGAWSVDEVDQVLDCIQSEMELDIQDQRVEVKCGIREKGVPQDVKTVVFIAFAKDPPESIEEDSRGNFVATAAVSELESKPEAGLQEPSVDIKEPLLFLPQASAISASGANGISAAPPISITKIPFEGVIKGNVVPSEAEPGLVSEYRALFIRSQPPAVAEQIQRRLIEQTGLVFDVPIDD